MQRQRTKEQIMQANLTKSIRKLKVKVADSEEQWLTFFELLLGAIVEDLSQATMEDVNKVAMLADRALDVYEERWGNNYREGSNR